MDLIGFFIALCVLLVVPGPTNALVAIAGAERGIRRGLPLAAVVVAGYLTTIVPVVLFAAPYLTLHPALGDGVKLVAAAWVLLLALRLWSPTEAARDAGRISAAAIYTTTLLNPKGLVIGLALLPAAEVRLGLAASFAVTTATVLVVCALWLVLGATAIASINRRHPVLVSRAASTCLIVFSAGLAAKAMGLV